MRRRIILASLLFATACATTPRSYDYSQEPDPRSREFMVGPGDNLKIHVWRDQELTGDYRVRPDGAITFPLVGDVRAAGRTASQIRDEIQQKLAAYMKTETGRVTVTVTEMQSYFFTVSGNVEKPGLYRQNHYVTVLEALTVAGQPNRFADLGGIMVLRRDPSNGGVKNIPIDYEGIRTGKRMNSNIVILAGDNVVVP